jgi:hypothetical protein
MSLVSREDPFKTSSTQLRKFMKSMCQKSILGTLGANHYANKVGIGNKVILLLIKFIKLIKLNSGKQKIKYN